ncbi:MAG TPA: hypothetical protein VFW28_06270 [Micropepsaceae bacterium]|nr:hypothetical protein [Micropepsaceae bacterium]
MEMNKPDRLQSQNIAGLAETFANETDLDQLKEVAIALSKPGAITKAAALPRFRNRILQLVDEAQKGAASQRIKAIPILWRLRQQAKSLDRTITDALSAPMNSLASATGTLSDPTDRLYFAQALTLLNFSGRDRYIADFVVAEGQAKTHARLPATIALIRATPSLTETFALLRDALRNSPSETQNPSETRARKLIRILESIGEALRRTDPHVDDAVGPAYAALLQTALGGEQALERGTRVELTCRGFETLIAFIRPNFSLVREAHSFDGIRVLHRLFAPSRWPAETDDARQPAVKLLREAIILLAQAGVTDSRLVELLTLTTDAHASRAVLRTLADEARGISNEVRHWLETGQLPAQFSASDGVQETILEQADKEIARAFRETMQIKLARDRIGDNLLDVVRQSEMLSLATKLLFHRIDDLAQHCQAVASIRNMESNLHAGDIVEYSPEEHESDQPILGSRLVRVASPQIVRRVEGRALRVVLKALVVPNE